MPQLNGVSCKIQEKVKKNKISADLLVESTVIINQSANQFKYLSKES